MDTWYLPGDLNPFAKRGIRIVALVPTNAHDDIGPAIVHALGGEPPAMLAISIRAGGILASAGKHFHEQCPETTIIGVRSSLTYLPCSFYAHAVSTVALRETPMRMLQLWSVVRPKPGPISALAWNGLARYLERYLKSLDAGIHTSMFRMAGRRDGFTAAFICSDVAVEPK